jgi:hypothetical protein
MPKQSVHQDDVRQLAPRRAAGGKYPSESSVLRSKQAREDAAAKVASRRPDVVSWLRLHRLDDRKIRRDFVEHPDQLAELARKFGSNPGNGRL